MPLAAGGDEKKAGDEASEKTSDLGALGYDRRLYDRLRRDHDGWWHEAQRPN